MLFVYYSPYQIYQVFKRTTFSHFKGGCKALEAILKWLSSQGFEHVFVEWQRWMNWCISLNDEYLEHGRSEDE